MSVLKSMQTAFVDLAVLKDVAEDKKIPIEVAEEGQSVERKVYTATCKGAAAFHLPGWKYPIVVDHEGKIKYDNHEGNWGNLEDLHAVSRSYAETVAVRSMKKVGFRCSKRVEENNNLVLKFTQ